MAFLIISTSEVHLVIGFQPLTILEKSSTLDICLGSEYAFVHKTSFKHCKLACEMTKVGGSGVLR